MFRALRYLMVVASAIVLLGLPAAQVMAAEAPAAGQEAPAAEQPARKRKRVAVVNFEIPPTLYGGWGNQGQAAAHRLSGVLSDMFITSLVRSGVFDVIERTELQRVLDEQKLSAEGLLDPATAPKARKILGVDLVLGGKITEFGVKQKGGGGIGAVVGGAIGVDYKKSTARAVIDARMIDTTTARIVFAEQGTGENSETKLAFGGTDFAHFLVAVNFETKEWTDSRIGRATRTAVDQVIDKLAAMFPVEAAVLAALPDGSMILDIGRFSGIKVGDQFELSRVTLIKDEETGEVVYEDRKVLGLISVVDVQDSRCKCARAANFPAGESVKKGDAAILKKPEPPKKDEKGATK